MVCPYRKLTVKSDPAPPEFRPKNLEYLKTEKEMFPTCQGEACPFYFKRAAHNFEKCMRAEKEMAK